MRRFIDRRHAGRVLASMLRPYAARPDVVVVGLPRGGVPVAYEVASRLGAPLDVFVVRKLGVPGHEELAMGALAAGDVRVIDPAIVRRHGVTERALEATTEQARGEIARRERAYRGARAGHAVEGKVVILVDDGLATGSTMRAAIEALRMRAPARIVVAVPVGAAPTCRELRSYADEMVCALAPDPIYGVGLWYEDFSQTTDEEVRALLEDAAARAQAAPPPPTAGSAP